MHNTPLDPTVPPPDPNDNPNPSDTPDVPAGPRDKAPTFPLVAGPMVIPDKRGNRNGNGDDEGADGNGNGHRDEKCIESLEDLVQRLGNLDALAYCALFLLGEIPRDPSPSAEAPMRRLWRMVEILANDIGRALQFADATVAIVRGSHRSNDGGSNDDGTSGGGQS